MPQRDYVGDRLEALRKRAGLSLSACARLAGVDKGNLWRIEHGTMRLPAGYVEALAEVLGDEVYRLAVVGEVANRDWKQARMCPDLRAVGGLFLSAAGSAAGGEPVVVDVGGAYVVAVVT
jgi:transcriptional regulator with XRE-family HTH domain